MTMVVLLNMSCDIADFRILLWDFNQDDVQSPSGCYSGPTVRSFFFLLTTADIADLLLTIAL